MSNDFETFSKALSGNASGQKALQMMGKLTTVLNSPDGRSLLALIGSGGGDALKQAAASVKQNDADALSTLVNSLLSSKEGIALITKFISVMRSQQ